jgi:hypothetical protein
MTSREQAAEEYARKYSNAPDKETPDWIINDFLAGYDTAEGKHREFYLRVRQMLVHFNNASPLTLATLEDDEFVKYFTQERHEVLKHLAAFTEREQQSLPFKD